MHTVLITLLKPCVGCVDKIRAFSRRIWAVERLGRKKQGCTHADAVKNPCNSCKKRSFHSLHMSYCCYYEYILSVFHSFALACAIARVWSSEVRHAPVDRSYDILNPSPQTPFMEVFGDT